MASELFGGQFVEEEIINWTFDEAESILFCRAALRAKVARKKSRSDTSFGVSVSLNKDSFSEGDEMTLSITATRNCSVIVFNILSDRSILMLFPTQEEAPLTVHTGQVLSLPTEADRQQGKHLRLGLLSGKTEDVEGILVIATKEANPFLPAGQLRDFGDISTPGGEMILLPYETTLEEIGHWLVSMPLDQWTFDVKQYEIRK